MLGAPVNSAIWSSFLTILKKTRANMCITLSRTILTPNACQDVIGCYKYSWADLDLTLNMPF